MEKNQKIYFHAEVTKSAKQFVYSLQIRVPNKQNTQVHYMANSKLATSEIYLIYFQLCFFLCVPSLFQRGKKNRNYNLGSCPDFLVSVH